MASTRRDAGRRDAFHTLRVTHVHQGHVGAVEGFEVFVVERGALTHDPVPRLQRLGGGGVAHGGLDATAQLLHLQGVGVFDDAVPFFFRARAVRSFGGGDRPEDVGPAVVHEVHLDGLTRGQGVEVLATLPLPPRLQRRPPGGIGGLVATPVDGGRGALEHVQLGGVAGQTGHALHARGPRPDDRYPPVGEAVHTLAGGAAGVGVVPATGVEHVPLERFDTRDARQLGSGHGPQGHDHEPGTQRVAAVGRDVPARRRLMPDDGVHPSAQQSPLIHPVVPGDGTGMVEDLGGIGVLLAGHGAQFLQ